MKRRANPSDLIEQVYEADPGTELFWIFPDDTGRRGQCYTLSITQVRHTSHTKIIRIAREPSYIAFIRISRCFLRRKGHGRSYWMIDYGLPASFRQAGIRLTDKMKPLKSDEELRRLTIGDFLMLEQMIDRFFEINGRMCVAP